MSVRISIELSEKDWRALVDMSLRPEMLERLDKQEAWTRFHHKSAIQPWRRLAALLISEGLAAARLDA